MIFTYTPKERERIAVLETELENALEASVATRAIGEKYGVDSPQYKEAHAEDIKRLSNVDQHFTELIKELENERFNKLKTTRAILKDAKKQTQDAIIYSFMCLELVTQLCLTLDAPDKTTKLPLPTGKDMNFTGITTIYTWEFLSKEFRKRKQPRAFNNGCIYEPGTVFLDELETMNFIKGTVLEKHITALKGLPEAEQLENYVLQAVTESLYTRNFDTFDFAKHDAIFNGATWDKITPITSSGILSNPFMVMYNSKPTNQLAQINYRDAEFDPINGEAKATSGELTVIFNDYQKLKNKIKNKSEVRVHQMLSTIVSSFTDQNDYSKKNKKATNYRVSIPLDDYLIACGHNIEEKETDTPEEAAKEKKRAAYARKDGRKKVADSLNILYNISLDWNGENEELHRKRILSEFDLERKQINVTLNPGYGDYLVQHPQTQYPKALLAVDARNPNAYSMGLFMATHYGNYNNQIIGTHNRLKVETLLKYTNLPDIAAVKKQRKSWPERIKEPFENSLDELTKGLLEDWEYTRAKGVKLTDAEAMQITDYPTFKNLYITFELKDAPDNTELLARRAKEKEESQQRKKQSKKKS